MHKCPQLVDVSSAVYFLSSFRILCGLVVSAVFGVTNAKYSSSPGGEDYISPLLPKRETK